MSQEAMDREIRTASVRPLPRGAERRKEKRYEVELAGVAELAGVHWDVVISDISPSGALISSVGVFPSGAVITLAVKEFGVIRARIAHAGHGFYGLQFLDPHLHRDRLTEWLRQEAGAA